MHSLYILHIQLTITEYTECELSIHSKISENRLDSSLLFTKHHPEPLERQQSTSSASLKVSSGRDLSSAVSRDLPPNNTTSLSPGHQPCPQTYRKCTHTTSLYHLYLSQPFKRCVRERRRRRNGSYRSCLCKTTFAFSSHVLLNITCTAFNYFVFKQDILTSCFFFLHMLFFFFLTANFL